MIVHPGNGAVSGYNIERSVRTRRSAGGYLSRTAGSGNQQKMTICFLHKRGLLGVAQYLFGSYANGSAYSNLYMESTDQIGFADAASATNLLCLPNWRDPSNWYQFVVSIDTTQAVASNRVRFYRNGEQITSFASSTYPAQNTNLNLNSAVNHTIFNNAAAGAANYTDGYLADVYFIDGQALDASSFGAFDSTITTWWKPKAYTGSYGTNGFHLDFKDNSALTTSSNVGLGKDVSGNGNYWTTNNISITAGVTYDSMTDVPTLTSETASNFCVMNSLDTYPGSHTVSDGGLKVNYLSGTWRSIHGSIAVASGKWYWEMTITAIANGGLMFGVANENQQVSTAPNTTGGYVYDCVSGQVYANGTYITTLSGSNVTDKFGFVLDADAKTFLIYKNGSLFLSFSSLTGNLFYALTGASTSVTTNTCFDFGQQPLSYMMPSGCKLINTFNLPDGTIKSGASAFQIALDTGANIKATTEALFSGSQFLEIIKDRANANNWQWLNSMRGLSAVLQSNTISAETTYVTPSGSSVGYAWKAGASSVTNTAGSITSQVSVNAEAGYSMVTYNGNQIAGATVGHGLVIAPKFGIIKATGMATSWPVYHASLGAANWLTLNSPNPYTSNAQEFNNTDPTSSVFTIGNSSSNSNQNTSYVAHWFAEVAGFSKFGRRQGSSSSDGIFIYTGFKVRALILKCDNASVDWFLEDSARSPYNVASEMIAANLASAESNGTYLIDFLSNGFKIRTANGNINSSANNYIYAAFAENPFKYSLAR